MKKKNLVEQFTDLDQETKYWGLLLVAFLLLIIPPMRMVAPFLIGFSMARIIVENEQKISVKTKATHQKKVNTAFNTKIKLKRWTNDEVIKLKQMYVDNFSISDMSKKLKKSHQAIRGKLWQLQKESEKANDGLTWM